MIKQPLSYACLRCRGPLPAQADGIQLRCPCCGTIYPILDGQVPILLNNPAEYLRLSLHENEKLIRGLEGNLQAIAQALMQGTSKRPEALRRLRQAYGANIAQRRRITQSLTVLGAATSASEPGERAPASEKNFPGLSNPRVGYVTDLFEYLRQDWGQLPDCQEDVAAIERTVADCIRSHATDRSAALVLGAGTGRFAWALRDHFSQIEALDLSAAMALSYSYLTRGELRFYELNERIAYTLDGMAREIIATIPGDEAATRAGAQKGALRYCVADALHAPFASRSIPVIVSVFFSDVVPMPQLLREVDRLLAPGGIFVHFGPLGYHFYNYEEMRTADEVRVLFASSGVPIISESWVPVWLHRSEARMSNSQIRAWSFVARRSDDAP